MRDNATYGFNKADAAALLEKIEMRDELTQGRRRAGRRGGGAGSASLFIGTMKENWSSGVAECDIKSIDGLTVTDTTIDADVYDPLGAFSTLTTGDDLYITLQNGKYYAANNAPCPVA